MNTRSPFETIASALDFMMLLEQEVNGTEHELQGKLNQSSGERSTAGLRLALYKVQQLHLHVQKSRRILKDLHMIQRVLTTNEADHPDMIGA